MGDRLLLGQMVVKSTGSDRMRLATSTTISVFGLMLIPEDVALAVLIWEPLLHPGRETSNPKGDTLKAKGYGFSITTETLARIALL